ncbi:hypothetical protein [Paenibacillus silvestris]|nr:hypothetical protein [Paenibacillus silvestris]
MDIESGVILWDHAFFYMGEEAERWEHSVTAELGAGAWAKLAG